MTTLQIQSGAFLIGAEIPAAALAPFAAPTGSLDPGRAYAIAYFSAGNIRGRCHNLADRFVTEDSGKLSGNVSQSFMYVGITDSASVHFHKDLVGAGLGLWNVFHLPGTALSGYDSSSHMCFLHQVTSFVFNRSMASQAGPLGDDPHIAKPGELPPKALVRVDTIRKACLTNLDRAQDGLFTEVEHPVHERPVCNLLVGRGMQAIADNHRIPQRSFLAHLGNSRHRKRLCYGKVVEGGELVPQLPPAIDIS